MTRRLTATLLVLLSLLASPARASIVDVYVYDFDFSTNPPGQAVVDPTIELGDTVRWVWVSGGHTTTSVQGQAEQWTGAVSQLTPTFTHTFTNLGQFVYYCQPHGFDNGNGTAGGMSGKVTVVPAGTGRCCLLDGSCVVTTNASCVAQNGTYGGNGSDCSSPCPNAPVTVTLEPAADGVLYEDALGQLANGGGTRLFAGNAAPAQRRRALLRFDLSSIPQGALVQSASLQMWCDQSNGAPVDVTLQRLGASWGEGSVVAPGDQGGGGPAQNGDATWLHRYHRATAWGSPGGDFAAGASASANVAGANAFHVWRAAGVAQDVQSWVSTPASNHGWVLRGDEASDQNAKGFASREHATAAERPRLSVTYQPSAPVGACCLPNGSCASLGSPQCALQNGTFQGAGVGCAGTLCPFPLTPFVDALPLPPIAQPTSGVPGGAAHYDLAAQEMLQQLHRDLPLSRVWGYEGSYPGPTIEARAGELVTVTWENDLRDVTNGQLRTTHVLEVDPCLHGPDHHGLEPVTVTHLHGGHVPADSDGYPEDHAEPGEQLDLYTYPNEQPAATLWYHDHALGITRLNVYMGLAGFYLLRDDAEDALDLPRGEFEVPLAIQDRTFWSDGRLYYPDHWHEHFHGDKALVNGKVWPYLEVKRGKYRFRMLNGSNARTWRLSLSDGATFWQIASDAGLMPAPVALTELVISPGERADVVIDFAGYSAGTTIVLGNDAPAPFPGTPGVGVIPQVMQFRVLAAAGDTDPLPASLVPVPPIDPQTALQQRTLELMQVPSPCPGHSDGMWTIDGYGWHVISEEPRLGTTEIWAWKNTSPVTHPMHLHLVSFQVLDRQDIDPVTGNPLGAPYPPAPNELGWKDTVQAPPSTITRVIARFEDYAGLFAYHCHILEHEDHEMMRQMRVVDDKVPFCFGDGTQTTACPCANTGAAGHGCANSAVAAGALLTAAGNVVPDELEMTSSGELATSFSILLQGTAEFANPIAFGDGLRCVGGNLKRLYTRQASAGTVAFPGAGNPSISARSAALGDPIPAGATRWYQTYYRDPNLAFCPSPPGNSWNVSNGIEVVW